MGGNDRMTADRKNVSGLALCALFGAGALLTGCTTDADDGVHEGTYAVTSQDLGNCSNDTWLKSSTTATTLVVAARR
jgi:hypothetical protein